MMRNSRRMIEKPVQRLRQSEREPQLTTRVTNRGRHGDTSQTKTKPFFSRLEIWIVENFSVLGDSGAALFASFGIVCLSWYLRAAAPSSPSFFRELWMSPGPIDPCLDLGPVPEIAPPIIYTLNRTSSSNGSLDISDEIRAAYALDGVVAIRGLIPQDMLRQLDQPSQSLLNPKARKGTQFHTVHHGSLFAKSAFWKVAVESEVPQAAHQLLQGEIQPTSAPYTALRVLRDIFLAKDPEDTYICGWHVDDLGFWPATPESPGINAWIALEDDQSSFAVAVGSHRAKWRHQAYHETGASVDFPAGGYRDAADYLSRRTGSGTCNLKSAAPHLHRRMEETARTYALQPGDVVFHTRWLFHRTVVREVAGSGSHHPQTPAPSRLERRYSVRYGPGSSVIPPGYGTEPSVLWNQDYGGRSADEICAADGPWYPQVWPRVLEHERRGVLELVQDKLPIAQQRRREREREMAVLVRALAKQRSQSPR